VRPTIGREELAERRKRLQGRLGEGVALVAGAKLRPRSHDVSYPFRQSSDLLYLTGFPQPEAVALLTADRFVLFVQPRDPELETWTGRRPGVEGAIAEYGADEAHPIGELATRLPGWLENRRRLYHTIGLDREIDEIVVAALGAVRQRARRGIAAPTEIVSPHEIVHEMRLHKSEAELAVMRAAADITREAHQRAARLCRSGAWEYEIEAEIDAAFRRRGGSGPAYPTIVGSGENATILHYEENASALAPGALVLIDAGAELDGYASDVTRTYPVDGRYQGAARDVYQAVLAAQAAALAAISPGITLDIIHEATVRALVRGLVDLGALAGDPDDLFAREAYRPFYMHRTSHYLGLDVHDVGRYAVDGKSRPIEPGMCFTVEPGLYFAANRMETPEELRGLGVRIEDDVVVTATGYENLTASVPKEIADVEAWMRD
jgi:Xaa-Pro aminopeptidase